MLSEIKPFKKERVSDVLKQAGIKVKQNRYFLSLPAFIQPNVIVLNFWYGSQIIQRGENIIVDWKFPKKSENHSVRMRLVDNAIKASIENKIAIRIIVLDGEMRSKGSKVSRRGLDQAIWRVTKYNRNTGKCTITRGDEIENAFDDLSDAPEGNKSPDRSKANINIIERDQRVRLHVIKRSKGKCEYCHILGFLTVNGSYYVEAHHIISLSDSGRDTIDNVIALCPYHHRQAHYGKDADLLETKFKKVLKNLNCEKYD